MRQGYTIAKDSAGNPSLLADCRTPIWEQERSLRLIKAGAVDAPDWANSVEVICSERGRVSLWIRTGRSVAAKVENQPKKGKK